MYRRRNVNVLMIVIGALSIVIIISLVYSAFTGQLNITGTAVNRESNWDIHFENVSSITTSGTAKVLSNHQPTINPNNRTQIQDYEVSLTSPNDSISFTFDVVNDGNYNASISDIDVGTPQCSSTDSTSATNTCNNLTYTLRYVSGATVNTNDVLYAKDKLSFKVTLKFNDISNPALLPSADVSIGNLGIEIDFEQQGNALVNDDGTVANNRVYHQGDKITLNNEDYWVIEDSGMEQDYVVALKDTFVNGVTSKYTSADNDDYDNSLIKIEVDNWVNSEFLNDELKEVNGYKARLLSIDDLSRLGYGTIPNGGKALQDGVPSWIYSVNGRYFTMSPLLYRNIYLVDYNGDIRIMSGVNGSTSVRPVINVYKSAIPTGE